MLRTLLLVALLGILGPVTLGAELTVYTYDALAAKGALGPELVAGFSKETGTKVKLVAFSSAGEALSQVALEGLHTHADVVVGIDTGMLPRAHSLGALAAADKRTLELVPNELRFDSNGEVVPFDYGYLSVVYDRKRTPKVPDAIALKDLASLSLFRKKLVIEDPRTSSLGLALLNWTAVASPDETALGKLWDGFSTQVVTVTPGWSGAYALFLKGEADFVVSYTTSPAYHLEKEKKDNYSALVFSDGNYRQVEGAAALKSSPRLALAKRFVSYLLSPAVQTKIPTTQWMYPVRKGTPLPASFARLPKVKRAVSADPALLAKKTSAWLRDWTLHMSGISRP